MRGASRGKDWKKAGLDEQDDPEVAEEKKKAEPSSIEEIGNAFAPYCFSNCTV